ncbi:MAG: DUF4411 family protein [Candidatus Portiera sp.]|nr:DUF4411 family protein [Portiera sp.]
MTFEKYKEGSASIPNICEHFGIKCINLEKFIQEHKWVF